MRVDWWTMTLARGLSLPLLAAILSLLMRSWSEMGTTLEDGTAGLDAHGNETTATISVLGTRTRGVFDWKLNLHGKSARLRWNGNRYRLVGEDLVEDVNERP